MEITNVKIRVQFFPLHHTSKSLNLILFVYVTEFVFLFPNSTGCGHQLKVSSLLFHAVFSHFYHEIVHFVFYAFIHT